MAGPPPTIYRFIEQASTWEESLRQRMRAVLLAGAFWSAITLPFLYIPLLVTGFETNGQLAVFLLLVALHAVTLLLGHSHCER